jgi:hypothetical protein
VALVQRRDRVKAQTALRPYFLAMALLAVAAVVRPRLILETAQTAVLVVVLQALGAR